MGLHNHKATCPGKYVSKGILFLSLSIYLLGLTGRGKRKDYVNRQGQSSTGGLHSLVLSGART